MQGVTTPLMMHSAAPIEVAARTSLASKCFIMAFVYWILGCLYFGYLSSMGKEPLPPESLGCAGRAAPRDCRSRG